MISLRQALEDYLQIRRRLGFEMPQDGRLLEGFVEFLEQAGAERVTTGLHGPIDQDAPLGPNRSGARIAAC